MVLNAADYYSSIVKIAKNSKNYKSIITKYEYYNGIIKFILTNSFYSIKMLHRLYQCMNGGKTMARSEQTFENSVSLVLTCCLMRSLSCAELAVSCFVLISLYKINLKKAFALFQRLSGYG